MKIYVKENGITFAGKAWEIKAALKKYMTTYETIKEWTNHNETKMYQPASK
ncbi:Z-ring formation inhibitor MciZ [Bacillus sp. FJAT-45350]|uniref:Z-ring formation inhibitor MciZ n=1 Tax=Bacillus sp. FJAT-45350 TaxID=2011014 RepID=UPI000BB8CF96|nr:Z-ring formation inhibitor MciZ [Bacillus sp. FJAT-45350]